ncbi:hypothetical protein [Streptomyces sp. NPDC001089]
MKNRTARAQGAREPGTMTLRVYKVATDGSITDDSGTRDVSRCETLPFGSVPYPPCQCPLHKHLGMAAPR